MEDHGCFGDVRWFAEFGYRFLQEGAGKTGQLVIGVR